MCNSGHIDNEELFLIQCIKCTTIRNNLLGPVDVNDASDEFIRIMKQTDSKIFIRFHNFSIRIDKRYISKHVKCLYHMI